MHPKIRASLLSLFACAQVFAASGKPALSLAAAGVVIDNGADAPLTLAYPVLANEAHKETKVASVTGMTAVVAYAGGGQLALRLGNGAIVCDLSGRVPAGWKNVLVQQGKNGQTVPSINGIVRCEAVPGAGEITLKPASQS